MPQIIIMQLKTALLLGTKHSIAISLLCKWDAPLFPLGIPSFSNIPPLCLVPQAAMHAIFAAILSKTAAYSYMVQYP